MGQQVREWRIHLRTRLELIELADWINPIVSGWMTYYGRFYRSKLYPFLRRINTYLMRWARKKYKRLRELQTFPCVVDGARAASPGLFKHWAWDREFVWTR